MWTPRSSFHETVTDVDEAFALLRSRFVTISVLSETWAGLGRRDPALELDTRLGH